MAFIYKICNVDLWNKARTSGRFAGAEIDVKDGFIHFSTATQISETLALHFDKVQDLLLLTVDEESLDLKWEQARTGDLFPHLYGVLPLSAVLAVDPLLLGDDGHHILPSQL